MSYGPMQTITATMASASDSCVFGLPNAYSKVHFVLPSLSTNAEIAMQASTDGVTYKVVRTATNVAAPTAKVFASSVNNSIVPTEIHCYPYIKLVASAAVNNGAEFQIICVY